MSRLTELMDQGYRIQISDMADSTPGAVFSYTDPANDWAQEEHRTLVFHTLNYNYLAYPLFEAHERNMAIINARIDQMALEANAKLDVMVQKMNTKFEGQITTFLYGMYVEENEDGSFTFTPQEPYETKRIAYLGDY